MPQLSSLTTLGLVAFLLAGCQSSAPIEPEVGAAFTYDVEGGGQYRLEYLKKFSRDGSDWYQFRAPDLPPRAVGDFSYIRTDSGDRPYVLSTESDWKGVAEPFMAWNLGPGHHVRRGEAHRWEIDIRVSGAERTIDIETWATDGTNAGLMVAERHVVHHRGDVLPSYIEATTYNQRGMLSHAAMTLAE